jgi:structure-specific recognition protein 1
LRGLAATKLVRPGTFRTVDQEGWALRCSHKADDGFLYPLERAFFFLLKPPILIPFEDIRTVEFKRQAAGSGSKTFDLEIRRLDNSEVQFRGLNRNEWENLLQFLLAKRIPIENLAAAQEGPGGARAGEAEAFADLMGDGTESDDDDFQMDDGHEESTDEDASGGEASDDLSAEEKPKASKRAKRDPKDKTSPAAAKKKAKKEKKEKDPDAPKKPLSGFMIFSNEMRAKLKEEMPGMSVPEMGRKLGELWKGANAEERERFATLALEDKARYEAELVAYQQKALRDAPAQRAAGLELSDDGGDEVKVKAEE